jgi:RNA polymerase sigma-70 factor (ECF subfamily)
VLSSIYRRELVERMDLAIGRLPVSMREAFVLRYIEKLEYDDISRVTGASAGAVRVRAHRARLLMRGELGAVVDTFWLEEERG